MAGNGAFGQETPGLLHAKRIAVVPAGENQHGDPDIVRVGCIVTVPPEIIVMIVLRPHVPAGRTAADDFLRDRSNRPDPDSLERIDGNALEYVHIDAVRNALRQRPAQQRPRADGSALADGIIKRRSDVDLADGGLQMRISAGAGGGGSIAEIARAPHADITVGPRLRRDPVEQIVGVLTLMLEGLKRTVRVAAAAHILNHERIAARDPVPAAVNIAGLAIAGSDDNRRNLLARLQSIGQEDLRCKTDAVLTGNHDIAERIDTVGDFGQKRIVKARQRRDGLIPGQDGNFGADAAGIDEADDLLVNGQDIHAAVALALAPELGGDGLSLNRTGIGDVAAVDRAVFKRQLILIPCAADVGIQLPEEPFIVNHRLGDRAALFARKDRRFLQLYTGTAVNGAHNGLLLAENNAAVGNAGKIGVEHLISQVIHAVLPPLALGIEAADRMPAAKVCDLRHAAAALLLRVGAARRKAARRLWVDRAGQLALHSIRGFFSSRLGTGIAESSACVYGCRGLRNSSAVGAFSTIWPRYMTSTSLEICLTTARSCVINRYV